MKLRINLKVTSRIKSVAISGKLQSSTSPKSLCFVRQMVELLIMDSIQRKWRLKNYQLSIWWFWMSFCHKIYLKLMRLCCCLLLKTQMIYFQQWIQRRVQLPLFYMIRNIFQFCKLNHRNWNLITSRILSSSSQT